MVRLSAAHQRQESPKQPQRPQPKKKKSKPVRVVYISNPMRVTASAAQFRDLVQRLTGRESNVAEYMAVAPTASMTFAGLGDADVDDVEMSADSGPVLPRLAEPSSDSGKSAGAPDQDARFEAFDEQAGGAVFAPQMWESLPAALYNYEALSRWILEIN